MSLLKLLLDADAVITLFETGLWHCVVDTCSVFLSRTTIEQELACFPSDQGDERIDVSKDVQAGHVVVFDVGPSELRSLLNHFDPACLEKLDLGQAESFAWLLRSEPDYLMFCSDAIVCRLLGHLRRGDQGISLEELLQRVFLRNQYTKVFREYWTQKGQNEVR
jgi:hypothetical protein